jgi:HlyD family secretion protein
VIRVKAGVVQAEKELARSRELSKKELISASELDAAIATYDALAAQVKVAEASVAQAQAAPRELPGEPAVHDDLVAHRRDRDLAQRRQGPDGRRQPVGPTIYVIADDMNKVQVQASVAEADIGRIKEEMEVSFTVDAHRTERFRGKVSQIRLSPPRCRTW